jgi:photosystem II stability/assembly factor-like uncharacterized protein
MIQRLYLLYFIILALSPSQLLHAQWVPTSGPYGGSVWSFGRNDDFLFCSTQFGGVFRSSDNGASWSEINSDYAKACVAVRGSEVLLGTYHGIVRSIDNGNHWIADNSVLKEMHITSIVYYGSDIIASAASNRVFRTSDGGKSWKPMNIGIASSTIIMSLAVAGDYIYATTYDRAMYRYNSSEDYWDKIIGDVSSSSPLILATFDTTVIIGSSHGVRRSTDGGQSWTEINKGLTNIGIGYVYANATDLFTRTLDGRFYRLNSATMTWESASSGMFNRSVNTMMTIGDDLFAGSDDGVYRSADNGATWIPTNTGMIATRIFSLATDGSTVVAGTHDGSVFHSTDNGMTWSNISIDLPHQSYITSLLFRNGSILAAMSGGVYRTSDIGASWTAGNTGLTETSVTALAANDTYIFAATSKNAGVFRSSDDGASWTKILTGLTYPYVGALAVNGSTIIATTALDGVLRSTDNGDHWTTISTGLTDLDVSAIAMSGATIVLANSDGIHYSSNSGAEWIKSQVNISSTVIVKSMITSGPDFYTSTNDGRIMRSSDNGVTWTDIEEGLSNNIIIVIAAGSTDLFVGTGGRGVWRRSLSQMPSSTERGLLTERFSNAVQIHPNPVVFSGMICYRLNERASVSITIYDPLGHIVAHPVVDVMQEVGEHQIPLPTDDLAAGVYLCSVNAGGVERTVRFVVVR